METLCIKSGETILYSLKRGFRFRRIRIVMHPDGKVIVTSPYIISKKQIEDFLVSKSEWLIEKLEHFKKNPKAIVIKHTREEIKKYKQQAGEYVSLRLVHWNKFYNFTYKKVTIKNITSRWGSCSSKGNLNFNYKIVLLSEELADYIIVHELCHLEEMNHSKNFWNLVAKTFPHHKELRKQLKKVL